MKQFKEKHNIEAKNVYLAGPYIDLDTRPLCNFDSIKQSGLAVSLVSYSHIPNQLFRLPFASTINNQDVTRKFGIAGLTTNIDERLSLIHI